MPRENNNVRPAAISCAGLLASLVLHVLFVTPVLIGLGANTRRPPIDSSEFESSTDDGSSMTVTFIEETDPGAAAQVGDINDQLASNPPLSAVSLTVPQAKFNLPPEEDLDADHATPEGSGQPDPGMQLLFGRYIGQITARIERAWMRPRTPIDSALFACRVRITQDRKGVVQEVELVRCNGNPRWQTSVVQAIESASPLPAPPDADLYRAQVTLDLQSAAFVPGGSSEGFEPDTSVATIGQAVDR